MKSLLIHIHKTDKKRLYLWLKRLINKLKKYTASLAFKILWILVVLITVISLFLGSSALFSR
ncbi:MAG: hypothetical protein KatS3mg084_0597 [Candidatus Dojkabacteria bacterium]|nr:MAG: hypothetical protein KatS3mg084_0597 [Candidatus Dojkabacteria bacterium]